MLKYSVCFSLLFVLFQGSPQGGAQTVDAGHMYTDYIEKDGAVEERDAKSITFFGDARWLAKQESPSSHWHKLPLLSSISLSDHDVSLGEMTYVSTLKGVTDMDVGFFPDVVRIDKKALSRIGHMKGIKGLTFYVTGVKEEDWTFLTKLSNLEYLSVDGEHLHLGDDFLQFASKIPSLETMNIPHCSKFTDNGIKKLESLQNLNHLWLSSSLITDESLKTMAKLEKLNTLRLVSPHLTGDGKKHLSKLKKLEEVTFETYCRDKLKRVRETD